MKVWEIKTHRHGVTLVQAKTIGDALVEFGTFHRTYLRDTNQDADAFKDEVLSCVYLGEVVNP